MPQSRFYILDPLHLLLRCVIRWPQMYSAGPYLALWITSLMYDEIIGFFIHIHGLAALRNVLAISSCVYFAYHGYI